MARQVSSLSSADTGAIESKLVEKIRRLAKSVGGMHSDVGYMSTGERCAVALVFDRLELAPHGYTFLNCVDRIGPEWVKACGTVQREGV